MRPCCRPSAPGPAFPWWTGGTPATSTSTTRPAPRRCGRSPTTSPRCCRSTPASTAGRATSPRSAPGCTRGPPRDRRASSAPGTDDVVVFTRNTTDALNLLGTRRARATWSSWTSSTTPTCCPGSAARAGWSARRRHLGGDRGGAGRRAAPGAGRAARGHRRLQRHRRGARPGRLAALAHAHGARIVVDAAQLLPHRGIDLAALDVDYVAFSGHKLYAPFGAGALVGRRDWLDPAPPHLAGGGAVREVTHHGDQLGRRARNGTRAARPTCSASPRWPRRCRVLAAVGLRPGARPRVRPASPVGRRAGVSGGSSRCGSGPTPPTSSAWSASPSPAFSAAQVAAYLSAEHGVGVRDGRFCAHPLLARLGAADGAVRASLGVGSSSADVDRLLDALDALLADGPRWTYTGSGGGMSTLARSPRRCPRWWTGSDGPRPSAAGQPLRPRPRARPHPD